MISVHFLRAEVDSWSYKALTLSPFFTLFKKYSRCRSWRRLTTWCGRSTSRAASPPSRHSSRGTSTLWAVSPLLSHSARSYLQFLLTWECRENPMAVICCCCTGIRSSVHWISIALGSNNFFLALKSWLILEYPAGAAVVLTVFIRITFITKSKGLFLIWLLLQLFVIWLSRTLEGQIESQKSLWNVQ